VIQESVAVEGIKITGVSELDTIHVFWMDVSPGAGYATIICYGAAWTVYFGAMSGRTIRQFFADVETSYLVTKMDSPHLKGRKKDKAYLAKIVEAVKESLREAEKML
jgi:acyl-coenzyme A synthetase/AMP-(fatty) acid ligase